MGGNQAISANSAVSRQADLQITPHGSDWLFTVCAVMGVATLFFWGRGLSKPLGQRRFHCITAGATFVSCISYFTMASNLGQVPVTAEWRRGWFDYFPIPSTGTTAVVAAGTREIFYVRYIDWFVTLPLLLLGLFFMAQQPLSTILSTILASWIFVVCFLVGALVQTTYKWGFFTFGISALLFVLWQVVWDLRRNAAVLGGPSYRTYLSAAGMLVVPWLLYPVAWGLSEGGNVIHPDSEAIFYGILDLVSKVGFGMALLYGQSKIAFVPMGHVSNCYGGEMCQHHNMSAKGAQAGGGGVGQGAGLVVPAGTSGTGSTGQLMTEAHAAQSAAGSQINQGQNIGMGNCNEAAALSS